MGAPLCLNRCCLVPGVEDAKLRQYLSWLKSKDQGLKQPGPKPKHPKHAKPAAKPAVENLSCRRTLRSSNKPLPPGQQQQQVELKMRKVNRTTAAQAGKRGKMCGENAVAVRPVKRQRSGEKGQGQHVVGQ